MADPIYTLNGVSNTDTNMTASIELEQKTGTIIKLDTDKKYLTKDIWLTMSVIGGTVSQNAPTIDSSTGIVTATVNVSKAGWLAKNASASSNTLQLTTQNGSTIAPTESVQTAVAAGKYTLGAVKIGAISSTYVGSGITQRSSSDLSISNRTVTAPAGYYASDATYNISSITVPKAVALTVTMTGNGSADNKVLTVTNNAFRTTNITNAANGTVNVTSNSGTTKVTSGSTSAGTVTIKAYNSSNTAEEKTIVSAGKWQCLPNDVNAGGTYWGRVVVPSGSASSNFTNSNLDTYLTTTGASSSSFDVSITPRHTIGTAGYLAAVSNSNGTTSYYKIITASPTFSAAPGGGSTASSSQVTMDTTSTTTGIEIQTAYTVSSVAIKYATAAKGWIDKAKNASTGSSTTAKSSTNGTKYYVTALQIPKAKSFPVTMAAGDANDSSKLTVTNAANRNILIENGVNTGSKVSIKAKEASGDTAVGNEHIVVENGYWKTTSITANTSAAQTAYGKVTIGKLAVAAATVTGAATATKATINNKNTDAVSGATNISGALGNTTTTAPSSGYFICLTANAPATTLTMTKTINTAGWLSKQAEITASASTTANNSGSKHYIPVTAAVGAVTMTAGSGVCTHTSTANATVSDSDTSGVYLGFKGKGSVSATATITTAGYAPKTASGGSFATGASTSSNQSSELKKYITGVEIKASKTFKLKVPNGSSTVEFTWTVDSSGNVVVT